jgi:hypothetical protein
VEIIKLWYITLRKHNKKRSPGGKKLYKWKQGLMESIKLWYLTFRNHIIEGCQAEKNPANENRDRSKV